MHDRFKFTCEPALGKSHDGKYWTLTTHLENCSFELRARMNGLHDYTAIYVHDTGDEIELISAEVREARIADYIEHAEGTREEWENQYDDRVITEEMAAVRWGYGKRVADALRLRWIAIRELVNLELTA